MELSAVILAGGESRRMGRDKAWVRLGGRPLLELAVEKVRRIGVREVFISGRPGADYSALNCPVLLDREPGFGPLGGIERALSVASSSLVFVLAVDMPHLTTSILRTISDRVDQYTGALPILRGEVEPLAAIYPKRCHAFASEALARSRRSARDFARVCLRERTVHVVHVAAKDASSFANLNSPSDLAGGNHRTSR